MTMEIAKLKLDEEFTTTMLDTLDQIRAMVEAGNVRQFVAMTLATDGGSSRLWDLGSGTFAETIGALEELKMAQLMEAYRLVQDA